MSGMRTVGRFVISSQCVSGRDGRHSRVQTITIERSAWAKMGRGRAFDSLQFWRRKELRDMEKALGFELRITRGRHPHTIQYDRDVN